MKIRIISIITMLMLLFVFLALGVTAAEVYKPYLHNSVVPKHPSLKISGISEILLFTGSEKYTYPIETPPGTNELTPELALYYEGTKVSDNPSIVGTGWTITENYIQRNINYTLYNVSDDTYDLVFNGQQYPLVYVPSKNRFHTKLESFLYIENRTGANNDDPFGAYWIVKTTDGTSYRFGFNSNSTMLHNKNANTTLRWSLDLINDTHGNQITYSYVENPFPQDSSAIYLTKVEYNNDRKRVINLVYENAKRPDLWMSYESGAIVNESRRLKEIFTQADNFLVKRYVIEYTMINNSMRSAIANITVYGNDNSTTLPPVKFGYTYPVEGWRQNATWNVPVSMNFIDSTKEDTGVRFTDINGDGYQDIIRAQGNGPHEQWLNNGKGWTNTTMWNTTGIVNFVLSTGQDNGTRIEDINNDGLSDIIYAAGSARATYLNTGSAWVSNSTWNLPAEMGFVDTASGMDLGVRVVDINNDGWPDLIKATTTQQEVWLNIGKKNQTSVWYNTTEWPLPNEVIFADSVTGQDKGVRLVDVNGDGFADIVRAEGGGTLSNKLLDWWKLDNSTNNSVSGRPSLTELGGDIDGSKGRNGIINTAMRLERENSERLNATNAYSFLTQNNQSFSIALWINVNTSNPSQKFFTLRNASGAATSVTEAEFEQTSVGQNLSVTLTGSNASGAIGGTTQNGFPLGKWIFAVYIFNSTNIPNGTLSLYLNGTLNRTWNISPGYFNLTHLNIGTSAAGLSTNGYNGSIQDVAVWSRALTDLEISRLYNGAIGLTYENIFNTTIKTWLNNASGWEISAAWNVPIEAAFFNETGDDLGVRIADVNGDGLPDLIKGFNTTLRTWVNNGTGWNENSSWALPTTNLSFVDALGNNKGVRIVDVNGDELPDIVKQNNTNTLTYLNNAEKGYLLKNITYDYGGTESFEYVSSTLFNESGGTSRDYLNFNVWVVSNKTKNRGISTTNQNITESYNYTKGVYDYSNLQFRGFGYVAEKANDTFIKHYFYQDDARAGLEMSTAILNAQGTIYQNTTYAWNVTNKNGYNITLLASVLTRTYDKVTANPKTTNSTYNYDSFGNTIKINNSGDTSLQGDEIYEFFEYANNSNLWIVDKAINHTIYGFTSTNKVRQTFYRYDNQSYGVAPTKGDVSLEENWLSGGTNPTIRYDHDSYGNLVLMNDSNNHPTKYVFGLNDTTYTFANKIINAKNQTEGFIYDLGTGNLKQINSTNGITTNYTYDVLGRIDKEVLPFDTTGTPTKENEYSIDGTAPEKIEVSQREKSGTNTVYNVSYFYDGFGNLIQIKEEADGGNQIVTDIYYDKKGRVGAISNPYFVSTSSAYSPPNASIPTINYTYDPLDRVTNVTNPDKTVIQITFDHWNVSVLNENADRIDYLNNAYGQIVTVKEFNGTLIFSTNYTYDPTWNIIQINDTYGHTFNYSYDTLGRQIMMQDPDLGTWNYSYDSNGNLIMEVGARGNRINYQYDELDRVTRKNSSDSFINYTYDIIFNGTIREIKTNILVINNTYDNRLRLISEGETINGRVYTTNYTFDSMDRLVQVVLPSGKSINYTYSEANVLSVINNLTTKLVNISYNQFKLPATKKYNSSLITNVTYNQTNARILEINTTGLQDLDYAYDYAGNVIKINDTTQRLVTIMQYDDLNRLIYVEQKINNTVDNYYNYSYDAIGNLMSVTTLSGITQSLRYNGTILHAPSFDISTTQPTSLSIGLLDWWKLNNSTSNSVLNRPSLQKTGSPSGTIGRDGTPDTAMRFYKETSDRLNATKLYNLTSVANQSITVAFWANVNTSVKNAAFFSLINTTGNAVGASYARLAQASSGINYTQSQFGNTTIFQSTTSGFPQGEWVLLVYVFNSTTSPNGVLSLYQNDTRLLNFSYTGGYLNLTNLVIGSSYWGNSGITYNGSIQDFAVWNRSITDAEIAQLYNGGLGLTYEQVTGS